MEYKAIALVHRSKGTLMLGPNERPMLFRRLKSTGALTTNAPQYKPVAVHVTVDTLPEGPREAFLLFRFEEMTVAEIATVTDTPRKTVESRLRRATELLAARLRRYRDQLTTR